jgi:hypothetical protein
MINSGGDSTVIVHIPFEEITVRINGSDRRVLQLAQGFSEAEFSSGERYPISCPLEEWLLNVTVNAGITPGTGDKNQRVYFVIEPAGPRGQDGQGVEYGDVNNITSGL